MRFWQFVLWGWLVWCASGSTQAAAFEDGMAQRTQACTACHGLQGRAGPDGYYPRLAGKPAAYLYHQLQNFRQGRRHYPLMAGLLDNLDDSYLHALADYFSGLAVPYPEPAKSQGGGREMERGRKLVQSGSTALGLPACTQCHGDALTGVYPATPGLLGLPADYINAQLGGWQSGQRHAAEPDCMAKIARQLSPSDTSAIARWLAAQPVPVNARAADRKPASNGPVATPQCGSDLPPAALAPPSPGPLGEEAALRGAYLARLGGCALCHSVRGGRAYAGGRAIETPFGSVMSSNITPDPVYGIGSWTANTFWRALHEGVSRDGHLLYPAFPYTSFTQLTRADSDDLFAYLKTLPAVAQPNRPHQLRWPYSTQAALRSWRALFFNPATALTLANSHAANGTRGAVWQRGQYLVQGLGHCQECHGARNLLGAVSAEPRASGSVLAGSQWFAPSLNDPLGASVAGWSETETINFLQSGRNSTAHASGPMAEVVLHGLQYLSNADAQAMAVYLQSLRPISAPAAKAGKPASSNTLQRGAALYEKHCTDCHGASGQGQTAAYPALAGNRNVTQEPPNNLINTLLAGGFAPSTPGHPRPFGMPPYMLQLSDADLAAVLSHIRSAWGNHASAVSELDVTRFRTSQSP